MLGLSRETRRRYLKGSGRATTSRDPARIMTMTVLAHAGRRP